jgi:hypothetical protein
LVSFATHLTATLTRNSKVHLTQIFPLNCRNCRHKCCWKFNRTCRRITYNLRVPIFCRNCRREHWREVCRSCRRAIW